MMLARTSLTDTSSGTSSGMSSGSGIDCAVWRISVLSDADVAVAVVAVVGHVDGAALRRVAVAACATQVSTRNYKIVCRRRGADEFVLLQRHAFGPKRRVSFLLLLLASAGVVGGRRGDDGNSVRGRITLLLLRRAGI